MCVSSDFLCHLLGFCLQRSPAVEKEICGWCGEHGAAGL